jgi:hypothetical protein
MKILLEKIILLLKVAVLKTVKSSYVFLLNPVKEALSRYFLFLLKVVTVLIISYFVYGLYISKQDVEKKYKDLIGQQEKFKRINKYVADLEKKYVSEKELRSLLEEKWREEKSNLEGVIKFISEANFGVSSKESEAKIIFSGKDKIIEIAPVLEDNTTGPPICYVKWDEKEKIYKKVYDFEIKVDTAISKNESNGKYNVLTKANLVLIEKPLVSSEWHGKLFPVKILNGFSVIDPTENNKQSSFYWFNPKLNAGINLGITSSGLYTKPTIGISWMGHGKTKNDLKWKFLNTSIDFDTKFNNIGINLMPLMYRPFDSFISNTYIGPGIGSSNAGTSYFIGVSIGL